MSGRSGYANGYGYSDSGRYDHSDGGFGSTWANNSVGSDGRERRVGGYGGFQSEETQQQPPPSRSRNKEADPNSRWQTPRGNRPHETSDFMTERRDVNRPDSIGGRNFRSGQAIEDVLKSIQREWDYMASEDCIPVQVALQLMDASTLGKADREPDFRKTHERIQRTLKSIVNEHHQAFNSSIGTYHKIQSNIQSSQTRVRNLRNSLEDAKSGLLSIQPELKGLATSSQNYDDIIQLFSHIQEIQSLPEKLESHISAKRFFASVEVLHEAFRFLRRAELQNIGALADLRAYFTNQETSLTDILIEELHEHLYLKSPYCSDRWKPPVPEYESSRNANTFVGAMVDTWEKPVYSFLARMDTSSPMVEDASRNPEADTFHYIQLLVEVLNKLGRLDVAVDRVEQRLPVELFTVVDKTNAEVDACYPNLPHALPSYGNQTGLPSQNAEERGHVLSEFLWVLYSKFEAIAEGHRVMHDVIVGIIERENLSKSSSLTRGFKELWKLYQSEIRSLLHDYLATDGEPASREMYEGADSRRNLQSGYRDKNRKLFSMSDIDQEAEMKTERMELDEILRSSVPGLVSKSKQKSFTSGPAATAQDSAGTGHKILIKPSVFNMSILLPPSLSFIQRLKDIVPIDSGIALSTLTSFLDDFLVNVFLPQLDETVTDLCTLSFIAADAFTEDPAWSEVSPRPIFKGTVKFLCIVKMFSKMLDSIPPDQSFTQLLISQIVTYYDKCFGWYKAHVTKASSRSQNGPRPKAAAAFAESGEIHNVVSELWQDANEKKQELIDKEIQVLLKEVDTVPLEPSDMISDPKAISNLSLLYNSMQWLSSNLAKLRRVTNTAGDALQPSQSAKQRTSRRWTLITAMKSKRDSASQPVYLPLSQETATAFDTTIQSFRDLATTVLFALHIHIRCCIIHMLTKTMAGPNPPTPSNSEPTTPSPKATTNWWHIIAHQPTAASTNVLKLSSNLITFDSNVASYFGPAECWFMSSGLARFIDQVFVSCTRYIGAMNANGALRLQLDVLVLQQNLKNIIVHPSATTEQGNAGAQQGETPETVALPRSAKFLDWFLEGAEKALDYAKEEKETFATQGHMALAAGNGEPFTYDELKVLVDLCFSDTLLGPRGVDNREEFMAAKKASADALLKLNEIMWDSK